MIFLQEAEEEVKVLETELRKLKERSEALASASSACPEEKQALRATIMILEGQLRARQRDLSDRRAYLQVQGQGREGCAAVVATYNEELGRMEQWLSDAAITHAGEPLASYGTQGLETVVGECEVGL